MRKRKKNQIPVGEDVERVIRPVQWLPWRDKCFTNADFYARRYFDMLYKVAAGRFDFQLPDSVFIPRAIASLIYSGWALFTKIGMNEYYFGRFESEGDINIYGIPKTRRITFENGKSIIRTQDDSVIVFLNSERRPDIDIISSYSAQLGELDAANDVNLEACKTPVVLFGDEKVIAQLNKQWQTVKNNGDLLTLRKGNSIEELFSVFDLKPTYYVDKNQEQKRHLMKECCNMLGVVFQDEKPERLITSEVASLNAFMSPIRNDMLMNLNQGFDNINKMFFADSEFKVKVDLKGDVLDVGKSSGVGEPIGRSESDISEPAREHSGAELE